MNWSNNLNNDWELVVWQHMMVGCKDSDRLKVWARDKGIYDYEGKRMEALEARNVTVRTVRMSLAELLRNLADVIYPQPVERTMERFGEI